MYRVGIDTGGTFTDLVALDDQNGRIRTVKVPSTPQEPAAAPLNAIGQSALTPGEIGRIVLGTTIATNARLQKKGATVLYVGTDGVQDVPIIGLIARKEAYNPAWEKPSAGVLRRHVFGIGERIDHKGNILIALEHAELERLGDWIDEWLASQPAQEWAVAVNLLFSYVDPGPRGSHRRLSGGALPRSARLALQPRLPDLARVSTEHHGHHRRLHQAHHRPLRGPGLGRPADCRDRRTALDHEVQRRPFAGGVRRRGAGPASAFGSRGRRHRRRPLRPRSRRWKRRHPRHGRHQLRRRTRHRRRLRLHHRIRGGMGCAGERALHRLHHHRRGRWARSPMSMRVACSASGRAAPAPTPAPPATARAGPSRR